MDVTEEKMAHASTPEDEGKEARKHVEQRAIPPKMRKLHDSAVTFQEYQHYASLTRADQDQMPKSTAGKNLLFYLIPNLQNVGIEKYELTKVNTSDDAQRMNITDEEWINASRALRTASSGAVFYLITTDIFGPFGLPYAFATTGWGPGTALYTVFGAMAGFSGYLLWDCFMGVDSYEFPVKSFGDLGYRIYGAWARYMLNGLQAIQLLCNVGAIVISNGLALSEVSEFRLCYAICCLVWALAGFVFGQIRTLQRFSWLANLAVFINLLVIFVTMGGAAHSPPLYSAVASSAGATIYPNLVDQVNKGNPPPVMHSGGLPNPAKFAASLNGAMQAVYSYGGSMIFPEFLAEVRRPRDFLKGMWGAQLFIYLVYMMYGLYMYGFQGQYIQNPSYLGISAHQVQTAGNSLAIVSALIAAILYGNIGIKVFYNNILVEFFHAPPIFLKKGKLLWLFVVPIYWSIAFIIAAAIPDFSGFTGIVAATCILNFTYTFPPLLHIGYQTLRNAGRGEAGFDPVTGEVLANDQGLKRLIRGFFGDRWWLNVFNLLYMLGALALCGLGTWASAENLIEAFATPQINAFSCRSPLQ
ncbi:amino acid transporter [Histoplasma capsulatum var. duboisii H88]|uniref:Amino acid transporter n=2 Tax=Ajellomyces capsulatus TaxID=5037 RepID=F0U6K7_AJEC8|nr:amino acid transporter [Histoplasma capsulatum H143]EGC40646.1 amino acid transporter [Histoplasma capsulatum var. duboisii H88]QSS52912.1 amino acid transporter [Histoplasma capsulatum var. duboisii H88]